MSCIVRRITYNNNLRQFLKVLNHKKQATAARGPQIFSKLIDRCLWVHSKGDFGLILCCDQSEAIKFKLGQKMMLQPLDSIMNRL